MPWISAIEKTYRSQENHRQLAPLTWAAKPCELGISRLLLRHLHSLLFNPGDLGTQP